ncbi:MAG: demethoxyubiquinone hydroxylase family protein, partial [Pseudomonadota bacterium]
MTPFERLELPLELVRDLVSDHAGETGAVYIYRGILAVSRDPVVRDFAAHHLETEEAHLAFFEDWLPAQHRSALLPVWRLSGWLLGALPALFGERAVFRTIAAVETFVEQHYDEQIRALAPKPRWASLRAQLVAFCRDEVAHRDDAADRLSAPPSVIGRAWAS